MICIFQHCFPTSVFSGLNSILAALFFRNEMPSMQEFCQGYECGNFLAAYLGGSLRKRTQPLVSTLIFLQTSGIKPIAVTQNVLTAMCKVTQNIAFFLLKAFRVG